MHTKVNPPRIIRTYRPAALPTTHVTVQECRAATLKCLEQVEAHLAWAGLRENTTQWHLPSEWRRPGGR